MLSRDLRLPSIVIPSLLRRGIRIHTDAVDFLYQKHQTEKRFACIVSAKVEKLATGRNRTKRLVSGGLSSLIPFMSSGVHGVIVVRRKLPLLQDDVTVLLRSILETAHLLSS